MHSFMSHTALRFAFVSALALGCGAVDDVIPPGGSCNIPNASACNDFNGTAWRTPTTGSRACAMVGNGATYSENTCATANRVGSCRVQPGSAQELTVRYYRPLTAAAAQGACSATGATSIFTAN